MTSAPSSKSPCTFVSPTEPLLAEPDFEREIARVKTHRKILVEQRNALFSPIARLPGPILAKIFYLVSITHHYSRLMEEGDEWMVTLTWPDLHCLGPILLVSRLWLRIATTSPFLWSYTDTSHWSPKGMRTLAQRSNGELLSCTIDESTLQRGDAGRPPPVTMPNPYLRGRKKTVPEIWNDYDLRYFLSLSSRMRRLELTMGSWLLISLYEKLHDWGELRYASLRMQRGGEDLSDMSLPFRAATKLRILALRGFCLYPRVRYDFPSLRSFSMKTRNRGYTIETSIQEILAFLRGVPLLETLDLDAGRPRPPSTHDFWGDPEITAVALPNLQQMSLQIYSNGTSSLSSLPHYLVLPATCSVRASLLTSRRRENSIMPWEEEMQDMAECLTSSMPHAMTVPEPSCVTISHRYQEHGTRVAIIPWVKSPDYMRPWEVEASTPGTNTDESFVWPTFDDPEAFERQEVDHETRLIHLLLLRTCSMAALTTFDSSISLSPAFWASTVGEIRTLKHIRIQREPSVAYFVGGLALCNHTPDLRHAFPALEDLEINNLIDISTPFRSGDYWASFSPISPPDGVKWVTVLEKLVDVLALRTSLVQNTLLARLTVHRDAPGCSLGADTLTELHLLGRIADLVGDLVLIPPLFSIHRY